MGVAFGYDGLALVVTATDFLLLDPATGYNYTIGQVRAVITPKDLPMPNAGAGGTARHHPGVGGLLGGPQHGLGHHRSGRRRRQRADLLLQRDLQERNGPAVDLVADPRAARGERQQDRLELLTGWGLYHARGFLLAQFPDALGKFGDRRTRHRLDRGVIYAQVPDSKWTVDDAARDDDRGRRQSDRAGQDPARENLCGRALLNADAERDVRDFGERADASCRWAQLSKMPRAGHSAGRCGVPRAVVRPAACWCRTWTSPTRVGTRPTSR